MGAKTPEQANKTRPSVKCDICGRKFLNVQALKSHHKFLHVKTDTSRRVMDKKQENTKPVKKVVPVHMLKRVNSSPTSKPVKKTEDAGTSPDLAAKVSVSRKPEFECPVCAEKFPVYFTAFRHIQKNHCIDENGEKVAPNSPHLVKPIRIEMCASCSQQIRSTIPHNCPKVQTNKDQYLCLGCEQVFNGLVLFQHHVKGLHADGVQSYFFPSRDEFTSWKSDLQEQINMEFIRLNRHKSKQIYHCSHQSSSMSIVTKLCPSTIIVREYTKGFHVCYYKEHCGHIVEKNVPLKEYGQYCISLFARETEELKLEAEDDDDLYLQFKRMVTCIVFDAAKVDVTTLKKLLGKALEMTSVLKKYQDEDRSTSLISKCLSDDQISRTLDSLKPNQGKRKLSVDKEMKKVVVKKVKKSTSSVENLVENGVTTRVSRSSSALNKSVPLIKSILKKNEESTEKEIEEPKEQIEATPPKRILRKTEEKPQKVVLKKAEELQKTVQKKAEELQKTVLKKAEELQKTVLKKAEEPEGPPAPVTRSLLQSPSSFNDSYKNFVDQNFKCVTETSTPKTKANVKKKEVVKTKIGQFKVKPVSPKTLSPKSPKQVKFEKEVIKEVPNTLKAFKAKPDIKYIVKEQENDCNILILKI